MNSDFHYYVTYCAAVLAGYSHEEAQEICYSAQLADHCTRTWLRKIDGPETAATTQLQSELISARTDLAGLQDITRIWSAFHFLPRDLYADITRGSRRFKNKYRLICGPNGDLLKKTVGIARKRNTLQAIGLAMHVLADTWAHTYFAGTPSLVINNTDYNFFELREENHTLKRIPIVFGHNPAAKEDPETGAYTGSIFQANENSIMNLGHGRAGHLPDYSFIRYAYAPFWDRYDEIIKDNPHDYLCAFAQMVYALRLLHEESDDFRTDTYAWDEIRPYERRIRKILAARRTDDSADWKELGEDLSSREIRPFSLELFEREYLSAGSDLLAMLASAPGKFFTAAIDQKAMLVKETERSGSLLAGRSQNSEEQNAARKEKK
ncbi:MAG: hypothetical protein IKD68_06100 [Solobacterium sp.]|nr:hypothetical protein [Solobacterium sp.]